MGTRIKINRSDVYIVNPIIIVNGDIEKQKTGEKSNDISVNVAESALPTMTVFIECVTALIQSPFPSICIYLISQAVK